MAAYYNEFDPKKAAWLRELIAQGHIAPGVVDERSILDVRPDELAGFDQCHLCAGVGIWSYALRLAGWPDDRPVWSCSEPCQPHSAAGKMLGDADERYIRPAIHHHIIYGKRHDVPYYFEQVANGDGLAWFDTLSADMEAANHTVRAFDLCSAGFGAPHIRQRLMGVANAKGLRRGPGSCDSESDGQRRNISGDGGGFVGMADMQRKGLEGHGRNVDRGREPGRLDSESSRSASTESTISRLADTDGRDASPERQQCGGEQRQQQIDGISCGLGNSMCAGREGISEIKGSSRTMDGSIESSNQSGNTGNSLSERPGPVNGLWRLADWLLCRDDKWRPVEPGTFPLAHGAAARVVRLRGYGDGINAEQAAHFIKITSECIV